MGFRKTGRRLLFVAFGVSLGTLSAELAIRIKDGKFEVANFIVEGQRWDRRWISEFDPVVGWIPRPGYAGSDNIWGREVTIGNHGLRSNGLPREAGKNSCILAVGDSFTFGDEVADNETWPAQFESYSGVYIDNGGVFAYGLDQTILRLESLYRTNHYRFAIISFITDDINRLSARARDGAAKPYFVLSGDSLRLQNDPVPSPVSKGFFRDLIGHSWLIHSLFSRLAPAAWFAITPSQPTTDPPDEISCRLADRVAAFSRSTGVEVLVIAQPGPGEESSPRADSLLNCARSRGVHVFSLFPSFSSVARSDPDGYRKMYRDHMTPEGNLHVARELYRHMKDQQLLVRIIDDRQCTRE